MKLYYAPGACSLSPHIVAREAGVTIELEKVDLKTKKTASGEDFTRVNPKGYVPALRLDDGSVLTEGPAIVQYLADQKPASGLAPAAGSTERYQLAEWLAFLNSEVHKIWSGLWKPGAERAPIEEQLYPRLAYVNARLESRPYLISERFSAADAYLFTLLNWAQWTKVDLTPWPALQRFAQRVASRPKVREALQAEGLAQA
jgi:glutathione S-transferase